MAPTKKDAAPDKEARLTPDQSTAMILDYLRKQNRPYSATDISANLKNRVTKTAAAKLLKDLHERKEIEGRAAGKQIVYHALQDDADDSSLEELKQMDVETNRLRDEMTTLKVEEKELRLSIREGSSIISLPDLRTSIAILELEHAEMEARLTSLATGAVKPMSAEERSNINSNYRKWRKIYIARRKICSELWKEVTDVVGKEKALEVKEELGLEF